MCTPGVLVLRRLRNLDTGGLCWKWRVEKRAAHGSEVAGGDAYQKMPAGVSENGFSLPKPGQSPLRGLLESRDGLSSVLSLVHLGSLAAAQSTTFWERRGQSCPMCVPRAGAVAGACVPSASGDRKGSVLSLQHFLACRLFPAPWCPSPRWVSSNSVCPGTDWSPSSPPAPVLMVPPSF